MRGDGESGIDWAYWTETLHPTCLGLKKTMLMALTAQGQPGLSATLPLLNMCKATHSAESGKVTSSHDEAIALFRSGNKADDRSGGEPETVFADELIDSVQ